MTVDEHRRRDQVRGERRSLNGDLERRIGNQLGSGLPRVRLLTLAVRLLTLAVRLLNRAVRLMWRPVRRRGLLMRGMGLLMRGMGLLALWRLGHN
ncbi:MAG: hypothetical protein ACR2I1_11320 [Propionibacteriaceae bacterium]